VNGVRSSTAIGTIATARRGRFAPSPTGRLHLGSLLAAVGSFLDARHFGYEWWVRIEDIDRAREVPGAADDILRTLEAFGLHWDGPVLYQHTRFEAYRAVLEDLRDRALAYPCDCERRDYAPAGQRGEARYPGRCRHRAHPPERPIAWRLETSAAVPVTVHDRAQDPLTQDVAAEVGDFVLWRKDGFPAYQLAVVVDDAAQGMTDVVRGYDLYDNTPRQRLLQQHLGYPIPSTLHLPLLVDADGDKLAKSRRSLPVDPAAAGAVLIEVLEHLQQAVPKDLHGTAASEILTHAIAHWDPSRLRNRRSVVVGLR